MKIAIIGSGIVGTATAHALIRNSNFQISMYDPLPSQLDKARVILNGDVTYTSDMASALAGATYAIIAVPTPQSSTSSPIPYDYAMLDSAVEKVAGLVDESCAIVIRSTIDPLKARKLAEAFGRVWFVPEFLREENYLADAVSPDRILIGLPDDRNLSDRLAALKLFEGFKCPKYIVSMEEAALTKLVTNSFLATKISFFNEVGMLAKNVPNVKTNTLVELIALDSRIGRYGIKPGKPYGGKCLPKDANALLKLSDFEILKAVEQINRRVTSENANEEASAQEIRILRQKVRRQ